MSLAPTLDDNNDQNRVPALPKPPGPLPSPGDNDISAPQACVEQSLAATARATSSQCSPLGLDSDDQGLPVIQEPVNADPGYASSLSDATDDDALEKSAPTLPIAAEQVNSGAGAITNVASDGDASKQYPDSTGPEGSNLEKIDINNCSDEDAKGDSDSVHDNNDGWFTEEGSPAYTIDCPATVKELKEEFESDIDTYPCHPFTGERLYQGAVDDKLIDEFLKNSPLYDHQQKCWIGLRRQRGDPKPSRSQVVDSLAAIMSSVIEELAGVDGRRYVMKTNALVYYQEGPKKKGKGKKGGKEEKEEAEEAKGSEGQDEKVEHDFSSPFLVIAAEGPSFGRPKKEIELQGIGFTNIITRVDAVRNVEDVLRAGFKGLYFWRHAIYARQMFIQQPNRRFVRTFLLDNDRILFFHFDRSGMYTKVIDGFHSHSVKKFVRLIVGLSSLDEEALGLDTSVQWKVDADGRKRSGTLKVTDDDTKVTRAYKLVSLRPIVQDYERIAGRSKVWLVKDCANRDGTTFRVADTWKEVEKGTNGAGTSPELELLKKLRTLDGVLQKLEDEAIQGSWQTRDSGAHNCYTPEQAPYPSNWICSRSVTESAGVVIFTFKSEVQLICGIRDAIEGHANMYLKAQTLHCRVEPSSIILGMSGAPPGKRGVLSNFKAAKPISTLVPSTVAEGDSTFISVALLVNAFSTKSSENVLPHDYTDDLQSFFYLLSWIMHLYDGPGKKRDPKSLQLLYQWQLSLVSLRKSRLFKQELLRGTLKQRKMFMDVGKSWSKASRKLLEQFRSHSLDVWQAKERIRVLPNAQECHAKFLDEGKVRQTYDQVLTLFDIAIAKLTMEAVVPPQPAARTSSAPPAKRKMEDPEPTGDGKGSEQRREVRRKVTDAQ